MAKTWIWDAFKGAVLLALVSVGFDALWMDVIPPRHSFWIALGVGLLQAAVMFAVLGGYIGSLQKTDGSTKRGAFGGILCGLAAASSFFVLSPALFLVLPKRLAYVSALMLAWISLWFMFAALQSRLAGKLTKLGRIALHGGIAALSSAPGFFAVISLWANRDEYCYLCAAGAWIFAYTPALTAVLSQARRD